MQRPAANKDAMADFSNTRANLDRWHSYVRNPDKAAAHATLWDMLDPDAIFESPVVHTPQRGRDITFKYLESADKVLGGPGFTYTGEWLNDTGAILEFTNEINGIKINGVDMISFGSDGRIVRFKVMVRPLKAVNMLHEMMAAQLQAAAKSA